MCVRTGLITPERHEADPAMASRQAEDNDITNNRPRCGYWLAYDLGLSLVVRYAILKR